jgi:hypothetical protein
MQFDFEALGLSKEDVQERLIETLADRMLKAKGWDDDGDEISLPSSLKTQLESLITKRLDLAVQSAFDRVVPTSIDDYVANYKIQQTNPYGQPEGPQQTFVEFIAGRVNEYLLELVDGSGVSQREAKAKGNSWYGSGKSQNRINFMLDIRLAGAINEGIEKAFADTKGLLANGIQAAVLAHLKQFGETLKGYVSHVPVK